MTSSDLSILRIDRSGFRPTIRRSVIWYLVESWSLWQGWIAAQERGDLPLDEDFEPWLFIERFEDGSPIFRDMAGPCRRLVQRLWMRDLIRSAGPQHVYRGPIVVDPKHAEGFAWVRIADGQLIVGHARIRAFSFMAVLDSELANDLAHLDLADELARWTEGDESVLSTMGLEDLPWVGKGSHWSGGGIGEGSYRPS